MGFVGSLSTRALPALALGTFLIVAAHEARAQAKPTAIDIATIGEPGPLDPVTVTSDLVSIITQHVFETLYTFDSQWKAQPLLAAALPEITDGGKLYTITLRQGVHFQDGGTMAAVDVAASLQRWLKASPRGKLAAPSVDQVTAKDASTIEIKLKQPLAPLLALLALNNGAAAIMPKALTETTDPLKTYVGTGPYKIVEQKPDQYLRLVRFEQYSSPPGKPDGYAGERKALIDELRFVPVPNATTRVDGMLAAQYQFADSLPAEMAPRFKNTQDAQPVVVKPFGFPLMIFNQKTGPMTNVVLRQAAQAALAPEEMLLAAFGDPAFFAVEGSIYAKGTPFYDAASVKGYNQHDAKKAAALLKQAGYKGEPIRIMTSPQYDFLYKMSLVAQQNLQEAGFTVDLQVLDWATLLQKRGDDKAWEAFFTYHTFVPEPTLITIMNPSYPGWWNTPEKQAALSEFNTETDPAKRIEGWKKLQALFDTQVPAYKVGEFYNLAAINKKLTNYTPMPWPFFWNVKLGG
ncbi:MAG TPA: ABC transporter substrate-binding protein [Stellaceae bacterium]|nr:ABC transporter substrate-binding protein [Stellaceae bacterium]